MEKTDRREFLKGAAAMASLAGLAGAAPEPAPARFNGIQMGPQTILDEGIDHTLDLIQETAGINAVMVYSHTYHGDIRKAPQFLAQDHGVPVRDMRNRKLPWVYVKTHEQYYKNTSMRHQVVDSSYEYANRDLFAELVEPCKKRGMKLYARVLDGSGQGLAHAVQNFDKVGSVDINGKQTLVPCWNHPDYRAFWSDTVEDMFRSYQLDGLQWGSERQGPFMNVILPWNDAPPTCFCEHCKARGKAHGIDSERARKGYEELYNYVRGLMAGSPKPSDRAFTGFLRVLLRYPELLAWEYQYRQGREEVLQGMYKTAKAIKPEAQVGWHVDHQPSSWDPIYRAEWTFEEMAPYSDFIKIIAYHDVLAPRVRFWYLARLQRTILGDMPLGQSLDLYYDMFGYDKNKEPKLEDLDKKGFSPDYVYRETKRSVESAAGKTKIYTGIGFDVPWGNSTYKGDPEDVYQSVLKAFEAGAAGIVVSREYEEMRLPNLRAVGRAMK
jgi:hypothetical protein